MKYGHEIWLPMFVCGLLAFAAGCSQQNVLSPLDDKSSIIVVGMDIEHPAIIGKTKFIAEPLTLKRIDGDGSTSTVAAASVGDGHYYLFTNVKPGQYEIAGMKYVRGPIRIDGGGGALRQGDYTFDSKLATATAIIVGEGQVVYMGQFNLKATTKLFPPGAIAIDTATGEKTSDGEKRAYDYVKANFPDSWAKRIP